MKYNIMSKILEFLKFFGSHPRPPGGTAALSNSIIAQVEQKAVNRSDLNLLHRVRSSASVIIHRIITRHTQTKI